MALAGLSSTSPISLLLCRMAKPQEKIGSSPVRQIRPPPLSQHLREFASRPDAWVILARNMIPVVGIYCFGWSAALSVFNYWFDGLTALAAIVAALIPRALRETQPKTGRVTWRDAWVILARNMIPVVGIYCFSERADFS